MHCRWSHAEHKAFIDMLKKDGKQWQYIAETIATKNEQQCRTRGLVLFNKLKKHCWDKELFDVLAPRGKYSYRDTPRLLKKKTLRIGGTCHRRSLANDDQIKTEIKSECSEDGTGTGTGTTGEDFKQTNVHIGGISFTKNLLDRDNTGNKMGYQSAAMHREKVKKIKEEYMMKKKERKCQEKMAREKRKQLIFETKVKLKAERAHRIERNRLLKRAAQCSSVEPKEKR